MAHSNTTSIQKKGLHPLTCYAGQISFCHAKIEKISKKFFVMINKDGGIQLLLGEHRANRGPPTGENPAR